jgi:4-hydroxybenzoate polyprenyltransferase
MRAVAHAAQRYLQVARLTPALQLLLPIAPLAGALVLASRGLPVAGAALGMLLATLCLWGAAWTFTDLLNARRMNHANSLILRGVLTSKQALALLIILTTAALLTAFLLDWHFTSLVPVTLLVIFTYPWLRKHTYLIDAWFGLGIAWCVPLAYGATGRWPDKVGALLGVVTLLWAMGWLVLRQWPHHLQLMERSVRSLGLMFGSSTAYLVIALQVSVLLGGWMAGTQGGFGMLYSVELLLAAVLIVWQALLLHRQGTAATNFALRLHLVSGAAIWLGVVLHFLLA